MEVVIILTCALLAVGIPLWWLDRRHVARHGDGKNVTGDAAPDAVADTVSDTVATPATPATGEEGEECCGMHVTCERDSLLATVSPEVVYYDDEELDRFKGRPADSYTADEVEEFRDVLLTLLPDDIAGWARSVQLRGIALPPEVRDELIMIVAEARQQKTSHPADV